MKIDTRVPGDKSPMAIRYNYISQMVIGYISIEGVVITEPGVPCLYHYPENYYNVSICPFLCPHNIGRYFSACTAIDSHDRMWKSDLSLEKYGMTQSGYFRLLAKVSLVMGIKYDRLFFV